MKIKYTDKPRFEHKGKEYFVIESMFKDFSGFEDYLKSMKDKAEICYFHSVSNVDPDDNLIVAGALNETRLFIRFRLIPKDTALDSIHAFNKKTMDKLYSSNNRFDAKHNTSNSTNSDCSRLDNMSNPQSPLNPMNY